MKAMILVCACVFLASCVNYKEMSAAEVGCLPKDIVIEDAKMGATNHTWVAICQGEQYICSSYPTGDHGGVAAKCTAKKR